MKTQAFSTNAVSVDRAGLGAGGPASTSPEDAAKGFRRRDCHLQPAGFTKKRGPWTVWVGSVSVSGGHRNKTPCPGRGPEQQTWTPHGSGAGRPGARRQWVPLLPRPLSSARGWIPSLCVLAWPFLQRHGSCRIWAPPVTSFTLRDPAPSTVILGAGTSAS